MAWVAMMARPKHFKSSRADNASEDQKDRFSNRGRYARCPRQCRTAVATGIFSPAATYGIVTMQMSERWPPP